MNSAKAKTIKHAEHKPWTIHEAIICIIVGLFAFLCVYPLWYIFINSFSQPAAVNRGVFLIPVDFTTEAYKEMMNISGLTSSVWVAVMRTVLGTILTLVCSSFAAYLLANKDLPVRKLLYRYFIVTMYVNAGFIPYYLLISSINLKNNFLVYILPSAVQAYFLILIKTYIEGLPGELTEAAEIDGAGILRTYWQIILPLSKPIIATIAVFAAVNQWNAWSDDMFFMQGRKSANLHCLQYLLYQKLQQNAVSTAAGAAAGAAVKVSSTTLRMAMSFVTVVPILCVYPYMQRFFTKGIMLGAVKG